MHWTELQQQGQAPGPRSSHALAAVANRLYLFGGELQPRVPLAAYTYCYDLQTSIWSLLDTSGCCPGPRVAATMAAIGDRLYLYGGRTGVDMGEGAKSDLYVFDTSSSAWQPVAVAAGSPQPPARSYHSMAAAAGQGKLYVFGGCGSSGRLSDLWCFNTHASTWQQLPSSDTIPARGGSVLVAAADGSRLFLLGGFNPAVPTGAELRDCHVFDTAAGTWSCPTCCCSGAAAAAGGAQQGCDHSSSSGLGMSVGRSVFGAVLHSSNSSKGECTAHISSCEHANHVVTFGGEVAPSDKGHAGAGNFTDILQCLAPGSNGRDDSSSSNSSGGWHGLSVSGSGPGPRGWFASACTPDGSLVVHGGLGADNERRGDMFMLCLHD